MADQKIRVSDVSSQESVNHAHGFNLARTPFAVCILVVILIGAWMWWQGTNLSQEAEQTNILASRQVYRPEMSATISGTVQGINRANGTITIKTWINADSKEGGEERLFTGKVTVATHFSRLTKGGDGAPERIQSSFAEVSEGQNIMASRKYQLGKGEEETFIFVQIFN